MPHNILSEKRGQLKNGKDGNRKKNAYLKIVKTCK